jgi:hypothetical protein
MPRKERLRGTGRLVFRSLCAAVAPMVLTAPFWIEAARLAMGTSEGYGWLVVGAVIVVSQFDDEGSFDENN